MCSRYQHPPLKKTISVQLNWISTLNFSVLSAYWLLIKPKNLRETSAPHQWRPNIGPGPGEPETRTAREKAGWEKREKWEGEKKKKAQMKKEQRPFYPLSSLLFPLHPSISQGQCSLGPERMKVKKEGEEKKPGKLSVEHHTCVENRLCPVRGKAKAAYGGERTR